MFAPAVSVTVPPAPVVRMDHEFESGPVFIMLPDVPAVPVPPSSLHTMRAEALFEASAMAPMPSSAVTDRFLNNIRNPSRDHAEASDVRSGKSVSWVEEDHCFGFSADGHSDRRGSRSSEWPTPRCRWCPAFGVPGRDWGTHSWVIDLRKDHAERCRCIAGGATKWKSATALPVVLPSLVGRGSPGRFALGAGEPQPTGNGPKRWGACRVSEPLRFCKLP